MRTSFVLLFLQLWGNVEVSLSQNVCSKLPDVPHSYVSEATQKAEYQQGHVIHFTCETGYISGPTIKYICSDEGWFAIRQGRCYLKPCELPAEIPNGQYELIEGEDFVFGTKINYFCNEGYQMISKEATRTCMLEGWSNHLPTCEALSCEPPPTDGGVTVAGLPDNSSPILPDRFLDFSCEGPGTFLNGSTRLVCGKDGQWDKPFPFCQDITCEVGVVPPHVSAVGLPLGTFNTIKAGQKLHVQCDNADPVGRPTVMECLQTGEWSAAFPICGDKCTLTGVADSVRMTTGAPNNQLRKGQKMTFACANNRHTLLGNQEVECLENGRWSHPFPTCGTPSDCGNPPSLEDGDITTTLKRVYRHGERVEYSCQALYTMEGGPRKTCNNGEWTGSIKCIKPCTVDRDIMRTRNIGFKYSHLAKLYAPHNDAIEFECTRGRRVGTVGMRQKCLDGVMNFPTCQ